ncbi:hypothetical protein HDV01_003084 [Terramyces sp. JEL0728]|nr:hypothetical protein HDV01_003084 [Terramyces sp. JEL0728]
MLGKLFQVNIIIDKQPIPENQLDNTDAWKRAVIIGQPGKQYGIYISLDPDIAISNECTFRYEIEINQQQVRKGIFIKSRNHFIDGVGQCTKVLSFTFNNTLIPGSIIVRFWRCRIAEHMIPSLHQLHLMKKQKLANAGSTMFGESVTRPLPKFYDHVDLDSQCWVYEYGYHFETAIVRKRTMDEGRCEKRVKL